MYVVTEQVHVQHYFIVNVLQRIGDATLHSAVDMVMQFGCDVRQRQLQPLSHMYAACACKHTTHVSKRA